MISIYNEELLISIVKQIFLCINHFYYNKQSNWIKHLHDYVFYFFYVFKTNLHSAEIIIIGCIDPLLSWMYIDKVKT